MSRTFHAQTILVLDADATALGNDGFHYVNPDFAEGSIICIDADGFVYRYNRPSSDKDRSAATWPDRVPEGIPLFRNYWEYMFDSNEADLAPYHRAIANASKTVIVDLTKKEAANV